MDRLKKQRRPVRAALTRCTNEVDVELGKENPDHDALRVFFKLLERRVNDLEALDDEIALAMAEANCSDQEQDEETIAVDEYRNTAENYRLKINKIIDPSAGSPTPSTASESTRKRSYKLPKTEIKKFNGEVIEWLSWWAQFQKIHEDDELHDSDKFQYLVQAMVDGSKAAEVVKVYPQTAANYPKAVRALRERFGKEKVLKRVYVRELLKLIIKNSREKLKISTTFDQLEGHLKALESLGITPDQMDVILFPMVESCVPDDILVAWQRSPNYGREDKTAQPPKTEFDFLMEFVKQEVENEGQRKIAQDGFGTTKDKKKEQKKVGSGGVVSEDHSPTAAGLANARKAGCVFCDMTNHPSQDCFKARKMSLEQKNEKIKEKKACFRCLKPGHIANKCKAGVKCFNCQKEHHTIMCREAESKPEVNDPQQQLSNNAITRHNNLAQSQEVLLKVVVVRVVGPKGSRRVRMLIDEGSQVSYIGSRSIEVTGCKSIGFEFVRNMLLGGVLTELHKENLREVTIKSLSGTVEKYWTLREKPIVCTSLPRVPAGPWVDTLKEKKISISDLQNVHVDEMDVELLIGSDLRGQVMTGRPRIDLGGDLYAEETIFGWALGGPVPVSKSSHSNVVISLFQRELNIQDIWSLDTLGIQDPIEVKTKLQEEEEAKNHFLVNVSRTEDGRYCVGLPWINDKPDLPSNKFIAEKRLDSTTRKLQFTKSVEMYDGIFRGWEEEGIVESVNVDSSDEGQHYLPHHPVFKPESKTTPVRPVFDASCRIMRNPSLNDCLYKGPNLIELIPALIHRFREKYIGVVSDIRKAFQMIQVRAEDRDYQRFLWWADINTRKIKVFRHSRVVFGVTSSPFLLGAVLELHLTQGNEDMKDIKQKLLRSMYVDNCVTSVDTEEEYEEFRDVSTGVLAQAKMKLRQWEVSGVGSSRTGDECGLETKTGVLGLVWDKSMDTLSCEVPSIIVEAPLTKRKILSVVAKIFDPMGFVCPVLLQPKLILQELWETSKGWDDELEDEVAVNFERWCKDLHLLSAIKIPRQMIFSPDPENVQLHLFADASQKGYAAVVFIRSVLGSEIKVQLVQAKARVAPLKRGTIPRLELMGCLIGVRLLNSVRESLDFKIKKVVYWTDSTTALAWIQRSETWGTFVANRVKEIRLSTMVEDWRHVPGTLNPADLPSRGCTAKQLVESKWWEGKDWLRSPKEDWPSIEDEVNEEEVKRELKGQKRTILQVNRLDMWFSCKFSLFQKNLKVMGWINRFINNCKLGMEKRWRRCKETKLRLCELRQAEHKLFECVQQEFIVPEFHKLNKKLEIVKKNGLYCVKTRLLHKEDAEHFRWPVILPSEHPLVKMMIREMHLAYGHPGVQFLLCKLREKFWILGGRRAVKSIIKSCVRCRRYDAKPMTVEPAALPADRVTPGEVFHTTGVDLAGPVNLKDGSKAWVVLYTCAVYRCVHFDVVTSLSTEAFLGALERFINMYGRPRKFYSDNGTNFVGVDNLLRTLDWKDLVEKFDVEQIIWTFNPPAAPWWGGWWERLVRSMKNQLRRMLGKARLTYDELRTSLSAVQATINDRPLTVVTEDAEDLIPITPAMFLHPTRNAHFPEGELCSQRGLNLTYKKMKVLQSQLQARFRSEYLAQLVQRGKESGPVPKIGDIVLIGSDNKKRFEWPIGKIIELIPGRDGHVRVAKIQTAHDYLLKKGKEGRMKVMKIKKGHVLTRPLQRLYPLEISSPDELLISPEVKKKAKVQERRQDVEPKQVADIKTRAGRQVKQPSRYGDWVTHVCIYN